MLVAILHWHCKFEPLVHMAIYPKLKSKICLIITFVFIKGKCFQSLPSDSEYFFLYLKK